MASAPPEDALVMEQREGEIARCMHSLQTGDGREEATLIMLELLRHWVDSLPATFRLPEATQPLPEALQRLLCMAIRLQHTCPHATVRDAMAGCLSELAAQVPLPLPVTTHASSFIAPELIVPIAHAAHGTRAVAARTARQQGGAAGDSGGGDSTAAGVGGQALNTAASAAEASALASPSAAEEYGDNGKDGEEGMSEEEVQLAEAWSEFELAFASDGRVSNMTRLMAFHPMYLSCFRETHNTLMLDAGPLPLQHRHLVAVMAASRHRCQYLMDLHTAHYLDLGGDATWLAERDALPLKFRKLLVLNSLMAFQPWLIAPQHLSDLLQGDDDRWSTQELVQTIVLMAHFHALCGFIFGLGVLPELDQQRAMRMSAEFIPEHVPETAPGDTARRQDSGPDLLARLKALSLDEEEPECTSPTSPWAEAWDAADENEAEPDLASAPEHVRQAHSSARFDARTLPGWDPEWKEQHVDFDVRSRTYNSLRILSFSWPDQGYATVQRYCPPLADLLDREFETIKNLTYGSLGDLKGVDTFKIRWAIWNYVLRTKGIVNDDYLYHEINKLLDREIKGYCKAVACYPEVTTLHQYLNVHSMTDHEKVHINLLSIEARKQAELLFALRAMVASRKA